MAHQDLTNIHTIVVHCSATREDQWINAHDIDEMHRARGWAGIGYHRVIRLDGSIEQGRQFTRRGAHVKGNNTNTIGICMVGGLDENGIPKNTFAPEQFHSLLAEIMNIRTFCGGGQGIKVCGHRDFSPDLNGDGLITPDEWIKQCPCFDVNKKMKEWRI